MLLVARRVLKVARPDSLARLPDLAEVVDVVSAEAVAALVELDLASSQVWGGW